MTGRPVVSAPTDETARECGVCQGHGNIWTNWHPTPVTCGHCNGTGRYDEKTDREARRLARREARDDG